MPSITFRGKNYTSEFEMPEDVRKAYREFQARQASTKPLTDLVDMPEDVKKIYERAMDRVEERFGSSTPSKDLPRTDDIYRQSAPENMKHLPSDESVYRASPPVIDPAKSTIEPEPSIVPGKLLSSILWGIVLAILAMLILQFLM